jgi:hypothetical protein
MQQGRVSAEGRPGIEARAELLDVDLDRGHRGLGLLEAVGGDRRDAVADEANDVPAQHRLIEEAATEADSHCVLAGHDGADAGHRLRPTGIDRADPTVRHRAAQEGGP